MESFAEHAAHEGSAIPLSSRTLPSRMDDWTKLDYYRFCLFQRQIQEEFLRENHALRSRLEKLAPGTLHRLLSAAMVVRDRRQPSRAAGDLPAAMMRRKRPACDIVDFEVELDTGTRRRDEGRLPAQDADGQSWRREVERLAEPGNFKDDDIISIEGTDSDEFGEAERERLESWRAALIAAARGNGEGAVEGPLLSAAPATPSPTALASSPETSSPPAVMELTPSRRSGTSGVRGRAAAYLLPGSPVASRRGLQPLSAVRDATPQRLSLGRGLGFAVPREATPQEGHNTRLVAPPSGDKIRRPRGRVPGDLRGLSQLRQAAMGMSPKRELIKVERGMDAGSSGHRRERA